MGGEGVQRATADFVCFQCPLEPAEKTNIIGKDSRIPAPNRSRGGFSLPQNDKKTPLTLANQGLIGIRQRLILPGRVQPSTFSTGELNFCVRDGNRWNLSVIATGNCGYFVSLSCTLTTAHRMILQTVPISSQFSVSDLLSLACVPAACSAFCFFVSCFASLRFRLPSSFSAFKR